MYQQDFYETLTQYTQLQGFIKSFNLKNNSIFEDCHVMNFYSELLEYT